MRALLLTVAALAALPLLFVACDSSDDPDPGVDLVTIAELAGANADLETLTAALQAAGLVQTLNGTGPFTVFAPTDAAFELLEEGELDQLLLAENEATLEAILLFHVLGISAGSDALADGLELETANALNWTVVEAEGSPSGFGIDTNGNGEANANITQTDISASNGVVHLVDRVLLPPTSVADALATYADIVFASYEDSFNAAVTLDQALDAFIADPTQANFDAAKQAWLDSNEPYGQTEAYRFANGPIDDDDGPEGLLNAWPLDEGYIDYVVDPSNEGAIIRNGIVNDRMTYPTIDAQLLVDLNETGGEKNISTGYHAIEFLLFGQDFNNATTGDTGGQRPVTDYTTDVDADRRKQYLGLVSDQLLANLQEMLDAWNPNASGSYRETFLALDTDEALANVFTGIGTLAKSELAVERMFVAVENQDQEDEHSCFSDNTDRDIVTNQLGIVNVYRGTYVRTDGSVVSGPSFADLVRDADPALAMTVSASVTDALDGTELIPDPFDQALINNQQVILSAVQALQEQGDNFVAAAAALGVTINNELPD